MFKRKELEKEKESLKSIKKQIGINNQYKENEYENQFVSLINMFRMSDDLSVKEDIANQIIDLRGELPIDIKIELDSLKSSMRK